MTLHVEKRTDAGWVFVPSPVPDRPLGPCGELHPSDWYYDRSGRSYDDMAFLTGIRNEDGFVPVSKEWRGQPTDATPELLAAIDWMMEGSPTWLMLDEIKRYDLDQTVSKPVRVYSPEELKARGWLGNGDGTPYVDIQSRRKFGWSEDYALRDIPVRDLVATFFENVIAPIEEACNAKPEDIRLTFWFD